MASNSPLVPLPDPAREIAQLLRGRDAMVAVLLRDAGVPGAQSGLGPASEYPEGETRLATFRNPYVTPTDGKTIDTACWVRRVAGDQFQVFAVNCGLSSPAPRSLGSSHGMFS